MYNKKNATFLVQSKYIMHFVLFLFLPNKIVNNCLHKSTKEFLPVSASSTFCNLHPKFFLSFSNSFGSTNIVRMHFIKFYKHHIPPDNLLAILSFTPGHTQREIISGGPIRKTPKQTGFFQTKYILLTGTLKIVHLNGFPGSPPKALHNFQIYLPS